MKELAQFNFSNEDKFSIIVKNAAELTAAATSKEYGRFGIIEDVQMSNEQYQK